MAKKLVEESDDKVWAVIEDVIADHPVLLNRAPTTTADYQYKLSNLY